MSAIEHTPHRPTWDCEACDKAWPCDPARERLIGTLTPTRIAIAMGVEMMGAARDMPTAPPAELYERFLGWVHPGYA